jgi:rod shape-determining protein MreD
MSTTNTTGSWGRILGSLLLAVALNQLPWSGWALMLRPDFMLLWVLFWALHQPARIGLGVAFFTGLLADFQHGAVLGQHAMAWICGVYLVQFLRLRLLQFDPLRQAAQLFPILLGVQVLVLLIGWLAVRPPNGLAILLPVVSNTLLWYLIAGVLRLWFGQSLRDQP